MSHNPMRTQVANGLHWVREEIDKSLERVRAQIEQRTENPDDNVPLQKALAEIHTLRGIGMLIQCSGVAILAEDMKQTVAALMLGRVKDVESACGALLGAVTQLSDYVGTLLMGEEDCVLVLQPALNELRLARGKSILTEAELFALQIQSLGLLLPMTAPAEPGAQQEARKLLPHFQKALLSWLKNEPDARLSLGRIGKIAEQIAERSENARLQELWRVVAATAEALLGDELDQLPEIKRLIGAVGQQIKLLGDQGEAAALDKLGDLSGLLLFHIGRSEAQGSRVSALRRTYAFNNLLPSVQKLDERRAQLRGPGVVLLQHVAEELRKDLARVKDAIDLIVRAGKTAPEEVKAVDGHLHRLAATLSALGLAPLQRTLEAQRTALATLVQSGGSDQAAWMQLATAILRVELQLEDALFHQVRDVDGGAPAPAGQPHRRDLADSVTALLRETLVNLSRLKTCTDQYLRSDDAKAPVEEASLLLAQVAAGFRILQRERIAELVDHLRRYVASANFTRVRDRREQADCFADAVASVEYYIESVRDQLPEADPILDRLTAYVERLELDPVAASEPASAPAQVTLAPETAVANEVSIDPEIRDIFIGEAEEVLGTLRDALPSLRRDGQDRDALETVRRAFHTLKGSGRMVGAAQIGEFGWAVEKLLNRCLDRELDIDAQVLDLVGDAVGLLPRLIERFRDGHLAEESALNEIIARANQLASSQPAAESEPEIVAVFREDAAEKLDTIDRWTEGQRQQQIDAAMVDDELVRMFHTLRGSGHVAQLPAVGELAMAVENFLISRRDADQRLDVNDQRFIHEASQQLRQWASEVGAPQATEQDAKPWLQRVGQMQTELSPEARQKAEERHLAEIFAEEAFDLLQKIESALNAWKHAPAFRQAVNEIRDLSHTLLGAALMSNCPAVANPARVLNRLMTNIAAGQSPGSDFFSEMEQCLESFFQILDVYREGRLQHDGTALTDRIAALMPLQSAPAPTPAAPVVETIIEMPPVASAEPHVVTTTPTASPHEDAELVGIFLDEADELLQNLDGGCAAWEVDPANPQAASAVRRILHTLKGSARVAGFADLGGFAADLEQRVLALTGSAPSREFLAMLHQASDVLHRTLGELRQGHQAPIALLPAIEMPIPEVEHEVIEIPPVVEEYEPASVAHEPMTVIELQPEAVAEVVVADDGTDPELARIFSAESAELLENLDQSFGAWQREPRDLAAPREMQRALHTLKGGARMAGLPAMGDAAHDMETRVDALLMQGSAGSQDWAALSGALEGLHRMHDLMERGDYAALHTAAFSVEAAPTTTPLVDPEVAPAPVAAPSAPAGVWDPQLFWRPDEETASTLAARRETARVPVEQLDGLLNQAGEISIFRSRLEEHNSAIQLQLNEMTQAIARVREQLRLMDIETEAQIAARGIGHTAQQDRYAGDFDPLEMDRYTRMQELSRALSESVGDLSALHGAMDGLASEAESLLLQQGRINTEVQTGLMGTLMVPFSRQVARLQRVVRQTAQEHNKQADAEFSGVESELDRNVLERMTAPLEHLLRNAVIHGIEEVDARQHAGKPTMGTIRLSLRREGTQLLIELSDDGRGLDYVAIRNQAIKRGLMAPDAKLSDDETARFIFEPGFSTAQKLTQDAGRGIGMDVVASEVKQLGGTLELAAEPGKGTRFLIRLPLNLAISQALLIEVGHDLFAIPLVSIEGIVRIPREQLDSLYGEEGGTLNYGGDDYRAHYLGDFIGLPRPTDIEAKSVSAILVRMGEGLGTHDRRVAVVVDALHGNREIVSKAVGPLVSSVTGVSGATILADGRVVLILDVPALALERDRRAALSSTAHAADTAADVDEHNLVMVVDDSVTIRRVTERLLIKQGYRVITAKDGLDAMTRLQTEHPAAVLLDIEMPRADGFEVATFIRNTERIRAVPVIMITSRSGDKHRERARQIGVNRYLIKPFQEEELLLNLRAVIEEAHA